LLSNFAGLEIYAAQTPYRTIAQESIRMTMRERRQELARKQAALLSGRRQDGAAGGVESMSAVSPQGEPEYTHLDPASPRQFPP